MIMTTVSRFKQAGYVLKKNGKQATVHMMISGHRRLWTPSISKECVAPLKTLLTLRLKQLRLLFRARQGLATASCGRLTSSL